MELSHLASDIDQIKLAAFIAAFLINRQAFVIVCFHLIGELIFRASDSGFTVSIIFAALYSLNAVINIKLSYEIRQALLCIACVNWLAALDYFVSPSETLFYLCYPWIINGLDVFILYVLLSSGGWKRDRLYRSSNLTGNHRFLNLQLRKIRD